MKNVKQKFQGTKALQTSEKSKTVSLTKHLHQLLLKNRSFTPTPPKSTRQDQNHSQKTRKARKHQKRAIWTKTDRQTAGPMTLDLIINTRGISESVFLFSLKFVHKLLQSYGVTLSFLGAQSCGATRHLQGSFNQSLEDFAWLSLQSKGPGISSSSQKQEVGS